MATPEGCDRGEVQRSEQLTIEAAAEEPRRRRSPRTRILSTHVVLLAAVVVLLDPFDIGRIAQFRSLAASVLPVLGTAVLHPVALQIVWLAVLCVPLPALLRATRPGGLARTISSTVVVWTIGAALTLAWGKPPWGLAYAAIGIGIGHLAGTAAARIEAFRRLGGGMVAERIAVLYSRVLAVVLALAVVVAAVGIPFFAAPAQDTLLAAERADAVVVLGPAEPGRIRLAEEIAEAHPGAVVLISSTERNGRFVHSECGRSEPVPVVCFSAEPFTTAGEAVAIEKEASAHSWKEVAFVTSLPHVSRARRVMEQCTAVDVLVLAAGSPRAPSDWTYAYLYQLAASVKEVLTGSC